MRTERSGAVVGDLPALFWLISWDLLPIRSWTEFVNVDPIWSNTVPSEVPKAHRFDDPGNSTRSRSLGLNLPWFPIDGCVWKWCTPIIPMVLLIIIPIKWLFHWEYTLFSDKPRCSLKPMLCVARTCARWQRSWVFPSLALHSGSPWLWPWSVRSSVSASDRYTVTISIRRQPGHGHLYFSYFFHGTSFEHIWNQWTYISFSGVFSSYFSLRQPLRIRRVKIWGPPQKIIEVVPGTSVAPIDPRCRWVIFLEIIVSKGNHPQMALIQVSELL